jgi:high-affinity nickel-transport protein
VSAIVSERRSLLGSSLVGALWGLGHTAALLAVAVGVVALHAEIPPALGRALELGVAGMLVVLGVRLLGSLRRGGPLHHHGHAHGDRRHAHPHRHAAGPVPGRNGHHAIGRRPLLVGLVHGLAGGAGLMLAVVASVPSPGLALAYVGVFGAGSIGGMALMSALLGLPFAMLAGRFTGVERGLRALAAVGSVVVGVVVAATV